MLNNFLKRFNIYTNGSSDLGVMLPGNVYFKLPPEKEMQGGVTPIIRDRVDEDDTPEDDDIFCRQCLQPVTNVKERIHRQGAHIHTFANPHGLVFEIGCFKNADGCGYAGPAMDEFTWFSGYRWRMALCRTCLVHLGWLFLSSGSDRFNGLILDRLL